MENKDLKERKDEFKEAANQTIPVMGLASESTYVDESRHTATGCGGACYVSCVSWCASNCQDTCKNKCYDTCAKECEDNCYNGDRLVYKG